MAEPVTEVVDAARIWDVADVLQQLVVPQPHHNKLMATSRRMLQLVAEAVACHAVRSDKRLQLKLTSSVDRQPVATAIVHALQQMTSTHGQLAKVSVHGHLSAYDVTTLDLSWCRDLKLAGCHGFPSIPHDWSELQHLSLRHCKDIFSIPHAFTALKSLTIEDCRKFANLPIQCAGLQELTIHNCPYITSVPATYTSLRKLCLKHHNISLPVEFTALTDLELWHFNFNSLPHEYSILQRLKLVNRIGIGPIRLPPFTALQCLELLCVKACQDILDAPQCATIVDLTIKKCRDRFILPGTFKKLRKLDLIECRSSFSLPSEYTVLEYLSTLWAAGFAC